MATRTMDGLMGSTHAGHMSHSKDKSKTSPYVKFAAMMGLSFIAMYILMYSMVDVFANVFDSVNQVYMAGLMVTPMAVIEIFLMRSMYPNKKINSGIIAVSLLAFAFFWGGIRNQLGVGDSQFVRSMIPHHAGAILMCNESKISDSELSALCKNIVEGQQQEIDQMKAIMQRL